MSALEPQFNALLFDKLGLGGDADFHNPYDPRQWGRLRERLRALFATQPRQHWIDRLEGSDACFAPVLTPAEAPLHPHLAARSTFVDVEGRTLPAPAPRLSRSSARTPQAGPRPGEHTDEVLRELGL